MAAGDGTSVGQIFGRLGFRFDQSGSQQFDQARQKHEQQTKAPINQELGFQVDDRALAAYNRELDKIRARTTNRDEFKAKLGGDFDGRAFRQYETELAKAHREAQRMEAQQLRLAASSDTSARGFDRGSASAAALGGAMRSLFNQSAQITKVGIAIQGISVAGAGLGAVTAGLAPLAGALAAYPALASAAGQGLGVFKLATSNVIEAVGGLNERLDTGSKKFKALTPEAQRFAKELDALKQPLEDVSTLAQKGLLPGLEDGIKDASKNLPVFRGIVRETADALGDLAKQAGETLGSKGWGRDFETQGARNTVTIRRAGETALNLADALRHVTLAAGPLVDWITRGVVQLSELIDKQAKAGRESGDLARFFEQTRVQMDRLVHIGADLGAALINIGKAAYPLGNDLLGSLTKTVDKFREWTDSARGENAIRSFFEDARPAIYELAKLIRDAAIDFGRLGRGDQVAPLLHTIRTELLPVLAEVVDSTTRSFGPAFLEAVTQALRLFGRIAGSSGPLVEFTKLLGEVLAGLNRIIDRIPAVGTGLSAILAVGGIAKALQIGAALTGVNRLVGLLRVAKTEAAAVAVAGAAGGGGVAGTRGRIAGAAERASNALPIVGAVAIGAIALNEGRDAAREARDTDALARANRALASSLPDARRFHDIGLALDYLNGRFSGTITQVKAAARGMKDLGLTVESSPKQVKQATDAFEGLQDRFRATQRLLRLGIPLPVDAPVSAAKQVANALERLKDNASSSIRDLRLSVRQNMRLIASTMDTQSTEGKNAIGANFRAAAESVKRSMRDKTISVRDGMREIRRLLTDELQVYGFSIREARNELRPGTRFDAGPDEGSRVVRAGGGWIGMAGQVGADTVPAMLAPGEAVLNRHQQAIVEGLLGQGFLDRLFANVTTPHYLAGGGKVSKFAGGGIAGAVAAANQLESAHFPYRWGGGHQATPAPFGPMDCSGAVSYVLQHAGVNIPTMTSGQLASAGKPGAGTITVFANPTHTFMRIGNRYFGTSLSNPGGGAGWMPPRSASGFAVRHFDAGDGAFGASIRAPRIKGGGMTGAVAQAALNLAAAGANGALNRLGSMGLGTGDPGETLSGGVANMVATLASARGWSAPDWSWIIGHESGGSTTALNPSGAFGIGQLKPENYRRLGGGPGSGAAEQLQAMARYIAERYGNPTAARAFWQANGWYNRGGRAVSSAVQRFNGGGRPRGTFGPAAKPLVGQGGSYTSTQGQPQGFSLKSLRRQVSHRVSAYDEIMGDHGFIDRYRKQYDIAERQYNADEGDFVDQDTGALNTGLLQRKEQQLYAMAILAHHIRDNLARARKVAQRTAGSYRELVSRLSASLKHAKKKDRSGIKEKLADARDGLGEFQGAVSDLGFDVQNEDLDIADLGREMSSLFGTKARPPDIAEPDTPDTTPDTSGGGDSGAVGITADQQAQLDQADALKRIVDLGGYLNDSALRTLSLFDPRTVGRATAAAGGSAVPGFAGAGGGVTLADGTVLPAGQQVTIVQQTINTLHPGDPATLQAVAQAANAGNSYLGYVPASNVNLGV